MAATFDDIIFWSERFRDHALFLFILLDENKVPDLKQEALRQYHQWNNFINSNERTSMQLIELVNNLSNLKQDVKGYLDRGQVINVQIPPQDFNSLVNHMIKELNFFKVLLQGGLSPQDEIKFWVEENAEHTELAGKLLFDPQLKQTNLQLANLLKVKPQAEILPLIHSSNEMAIRLDNALRSGQVKGLMDPIMLEHEIKEAQRGEQRIKQLLNRS